MLTYLSTMAILFFNSSKVLDVLSKSNQSWNRMSTENSNFIVLYGEELK